MPPPSEPAARPTSIVIADDHSLVRSGLRALLDGVDDLEVVGEAADVDATLAEVGARHPDVVLLDLGMAGSISALVAIARVGAVSAATRVVVLTMHSDPAFARAAMQAGAMGYVLKESADDALVEAIRRATDGGRYVDPSLGAALAAPRSVTTGDLTSRELDVLRLIAMGHTNAEIGRALGLSIRTIESHRAHIQRKLGRPTRAELVRFALERRLLGA